MHTILASNPFFMAYRMTDFFGKSVLILLVVISIVTWMVILHKWLHLKRARKASWKFYQLFQQRQGEPLSITLESAPTSLPLNPFLHLYAQLKKQSLDLTKGGEKPLSGEDRALLESHLVSGMHAQVQQLESHLFILATIVTLAPFLGLLGTVWGILTTFSELPHQAAGGTNQLILGGISMALATTVIGLLDAIPALVSYNYLRQAIRSFAGEMECFCCEMMASLELYTRSR